MISGSVTEAITVVNNWAHISCLSQTCYHVSCTCSVLALTTWLWHYTRASVNRSALTCQLQLHSRRPSCLDTGFSLLLMEHRWCSTSSHLTPAWLPITEWLTRKCLLIHKIILGYILPSTLQTNWHHLPTFQHDPHYVHWWPCHASNKSKDWTWSLFCYCSTCLDQTSDGDRTCCYDALQLLGLKITTILFL